MHNAAALQVVVLLGVSVLALTLVARKLGVAPPIVLLIGGVPLAFVPWLDNVRLAPEVVLLLFLPALLYWESFNTSLRTIRRDLRAILLTAILLVLLTAAAVAAVGHAIGLSWPVAWVLGAVLAPTDATAVAAVAGRMPRRHLTARRAESLINDGTALVLLAIAVEGCHRAGAFRLDQGADRVRGVVPRRRRGRAAGGLADRPHPQDQT